MKTSQSKTAQSLCAGLLVLAASPSFATITAFDFVGNGGVGLLPGNEVGNNTATSTTSTAFGGEAGNGLSFDDSTNILSFDFSFEGLSGGLFDAASGIHLHLPGTAGDPFNQTGPIVFNLNSFDDAAVTNTNDQIDFESTSGRVTGEISFADNLDLVDDLLAGEFYLNIHSGDFTGGELRGSLTAIPEPSSASLAALAFAGLIARRRRKA